MGTLLLILSIGLTLCESTILSIAIYFLLRQAPFAKRDSIIILLSIIVVATLYLTMSANIVLKSLITFVVLVFLCAKIYQAPKALVLFFVVSIFYIFVAVDLLLGNLLAWLLPGNVLEILSSNEPVALFYGYSSKALQGLTVYLFVRAFRNVEWNLPIRQWIDLSVTALLSYIIAITFMMINPVLQNHINPLFIAIIVTCFFVVTVSIASLFIRLAKHYREEQIHYITKAATESLDTQIDQLIQSRNEAAKSVHDVRNILLNVKALLDHEEFEFASEMIAEFSIESMQVKIDTVTGNTIIDAALALEKEKAKSKGVSLIIESQTLQKLLISAKDVVTVIGNLLDNAIEAASENGCHSKTVTVGLFYINDLINIVVSNEHSRSLISGSRKLRTSKEDKVYHGWGLHIVDEICRKHNGYFTKEFDLNRFTAHAALSNQ